MFGAIREFQAPLGVTHGVRGRFGQPSNSNATIFARKNTLDMYVVRANKESARLELLHSTSLAANVMSMASFRRSNANSDLLCVGFENMRVVILLWDHDQQKWISEQLLDLGAMIGITGCAQSSVLQVKDHDGSSQPMLRGKIGANSLPLIRSDPAGRCIAVLARGHNIIYIIPLHGDDDSSKGGNVVNTRDIFLIDLPVDYEETNVKDFTFSYGSFEPNLVILCESKRTWAGRAAIQSNTCSLLSMSIDVKSKKSSKTWAMDQLPYDCEKLEAIPESAGSGVLIISARIIMQMRHGACVAALSLNCFGDSYADSVKSKYDNITASDTVVECDAAHCRFLDIEEYQNDNTNAGVQNIALLSLKGGELYFLTVAGPSRTSIHLKRAGSTVIASEIVPINDRFFILTSRLSDSSLIEYQRSASEGQSEDDKEKKTKNAGEKKASKNIKGKKKRKRTPEEVAEYEMIYGTYPPDDSGDEDSQDDDDDPLGLEKAEEGTRGVYDDEDELGSVFNSFREGDQSSGAGTSLDSWALKVKDTISSFGPGSDLAIGHTPDDITRSKLEMVIAGGYAKNGCLAVLHQTVRPIIRKEFETANCTGVWALSDLEITRQESAQRRLSVIARNVEKRERNENKVLAKNKFIEEELLRLKQERLEEKLEKEKKESESHKNQDQNETAIDEELLDNSNTGDNEKPNETENGEAEVKNDTLENNVLPDQEDDGQAPASKKIRIEGKDDEALSSIAKLESTESVVEIDEDTLRAIQLQAESMYPLDKEEDFENFSDESSLHAYMLLSGKSSTTVLRTGDEEITELPNDSTNFITSEETVCAGNVFGGSAIVQIVSSKVRILYKGNNVSEWNLKSMDSYIASAQISDPLILLQTNDNSVFILSLNAHEYEEKGNKSKGIKSYRDFSINVDVSPDRKFSEFTSVATSYIYKGQLATEIAKDGILIDVGGRETEAKSEKPFRVSPTEADDPFQQSNELNAEPNPDPPKEKYQIDDDDRMLYGDNDDDLLYGAEPKESSEAMDIDTKADAEGITPDDKNNQGSKLGAMNEGNDTQKQSTKKIPEKGVFDLPSNQEKSSTDEHLIVLMKKNGTLIVLSKPLDYATVLECPTFFAGPAFFKDMTVSQDMADSLPQAPSDFQIKQLALVELTGSALLSGLSTPMLVAIPQMGIPLIYRAFLATKQSPGLGQRSRLRFRRITFQDRTTHLFARCMRDSLAESEGNSNISQEQNKRPLAHFKNIAGRGGLFVGGSCPFFLFAERGYPRVHSLSFTHTSNKVISQEEYDRGQGIIAFAEFHNFNCRRGFIYVGNDGRVRIGGLPPPSDMNYDSPTPMKKIALRCTPHKVEYHAGSETYGVLASMPTLTTREERLARILQSLEKHDKRHYQHTAAQAEAETGVEKANRDPPLFEELHELRIYTPDTWDLVKSHKLQKGEVGLTISNMTVDVYKPKTSLSGNMHSSKKGDDGNESAFAASLKLRPKNMLVVGTGHLNGEDASSRGRLLMFEVSRQDVYTENRPVYKAFQLQLIAEKELFSPVTAVAPMEGYVIAAVGPQVNVYKLVGDEIVHLSFAFGQLYCTSMASLKQYVVTADMWKSVSFMYYRDRNNSVNFLGKDYEYVKSYATEFLIEGDNMSIIVTDDGGNFQMLNYVHASVPASRGGKRLLTYGGLHLGSRVNTLVRLRAPDKEAMIADNELATGSGKHTLMFSTLDGGTGALIALTESEYEEMERLRKLLVNYAGVARLGSINLEEQAAFRREVKSSVLLEQRLTDTRMVYDLFTLTLPEIDMIMRDVGSSVKTSVDTLLSVDSVLSRF